jgi:Ser/Thr protein kinase RdoA (MazF antagonist)
MSPEEALEQVNATAHTTYTLNAEYAGGEDQGAFRVVNAEGIRAVLKINRNPQWINQVQRAKAATTHLATLGYPVPVYSIIGSTDRGTYSLQSELSGSGNTQATAGAVSRLLQLIELQKGQAISEVQGQDWVWYLMDVVFRGESGSVRILMQFSPETSSLVTDIESLVLGLQGKMLPKDDIVHGDMGIGQVLFSGDNVTGVLDWDQVGYGDRTQDYVSLWYSLLALPEPRDLVMRAMLETSDKEAVKIHAVYKMLTDVTWHINKPGGDVPAAAASARMAIQLLRQLG